MYKTTVHDKIVLNGMLDVNYNKLDFSDSITYITTTLSVTNKIGYFLNTDLNIHNLCVVTFRKLPPNSLSLIIINYNIIMK